MRNLGVEVVVCPRRGIQHNQQCKSLEAPAAVMFLVAVKRDTLCFGHPECLAVLVRAALLSFATPGRFDKHSALLAGQGADLALDIRVAHKVEQDGQILGLPVARKVHVHALVPGVLGRVEAVQ